jgi:hypothetical protein
MFNLNISRGLPQYNEENRDYPRDEKVGDDVGEDAYKIL